VAGNLVRNLSLTGPYVPEDGTFGTGIGVEADTAITGNVVDSAPKFGLALGWGPYLRNVTIAGTSSQAPSAAPSLGMEWDKAVSGDIAHDGAARYPQLTVANNRVG
jgi:putative cofactor-binding repeat protein